MRLVRDKRGQFIIIAALLIAIMIISASTVMFSTVTYFKHERWEEYLTAIDGVKSGTAHLLELSLANYTQTWNSSVLKTNLDCWKQDVKRAYSGFGVIVSYSLASGSRSVYGMSLNYNLGLASQNFSQISFSAANVTASLNVTSVGLTGYGFVSAVFLKMNITDALWYAGQGNNPGQIGVRVVMYEEGPAFLTDLQKSNFVLFQIVGMGSPTFSLFRYYESVKHGGNPALNAYVYELRYTHSSKDKPSTITATISAVDARGIKVTGQATLNTVTA